MRAGFALPGLADRGFANGTRWKQRSFFAQALRLFGETFFERVGLRETAALLLHGAAPIPLEEGGSATGVLITDDCHGPGGDGLSV
jgi:hypothetical protein